MFTVVVILGLILGVFAMTCLIIEISSKGKQ